MTDFMQSERSKKLLQSFSSVFDDILGREGFGDYKAILSEPITTYGQLLASSEEISKRLTTIGISKGDILGVCLPLGLHYVATIIAIYTIGGVAVLMNPRATVEENNYIIEHSGMRFLISEMSITLAASLSEITRTHIPNGLLVVGPLSSDIRDIVDNDRLIIYTSGSTGRPKSAVLTDQGISNNVRAISDYLTLSSLDRTVVFTPPAYTFAISQVLTHLWVGASIVLLPYGLMYPFEILRGIENHKLTGIATNPTSARIMNEIELSSAEMLDSVRYVMSVGQEFDGRLAVDIAARFRRARIVNTYGCTENSPRISYYWLPPVVPYRDQPWPVGRPVEGTEIKVVDEAGSPTVPYAIGHVLFRGTSMMRCYWRDPLLTQQRVVDGWFRTGDLGFTDAEGNLNLVGRADNIINVGHEKVSPEEVEAVIRTIDNVVDVAIVPVDEYILGSVPIALIVVDNLEDDVLTKVRNECNRRFSSPKVPRKFIIVESLPKTLYGKIDRGKLKQLVKDLGISIKHRRPRRAR